MVVVHAFGIACACQTSVIVIPWEKLRKGWSILLDAYFSFVHRSFVRRFSAQIIHIS